MKCPFEGYDCDCAGEIEERHRNTSYHFSEEDRKAGKEDPNMMVSCEAHWKLDYDRYQELWDEYRRGQL